MNTLLNDVRYAIRGLVRSRTFTVIAVLARAAGVGANTAIFSVVNTVLLRALPYPQPDRIVMLWEHNRSKDLVPHQSVSPANLLAWQDEPKSLSAMGVIVLAAVALLASFLPARRATLVDPVTSSATSREVTR